MQHVKMLTSLCSASCVADNVALSAFAAARLLLSDEQQ